MDRTACSTTSSVYTYMFLGPLAICWPIHSHHSYHATSCIVSPEEPSLTPSSWPMELTTSLAPSYPVALLLWVHFPYVSKSCR